MVPVRVVQVAVDEVVDMIPMGQGLVTAAWAMHVAGFVPWAAVVRRADRRIDVTDRYDVFVDVVAVRMMQMTVMQIVDMVAVQHRGMAAARAVNVVVVGMVDLGAGGRSGDHGRILQAGAVRLRRGARDALQWIDTVWRSVLIGRGQPRQTQPILNGLGESQFRASQPPAAEAASRRRPPLAGLRQEQT